MIGLLFALALSSYNNDLPPVKFQGNPPPAVVLIVDNTNSPETCGVAAPGWVIRACEKPAKHGVPVVTMPNPCTFPEAADIMSYAHLLCHEFGHANGWNSDHDN